MQKLETLAALRQIPRKQVRESQLVGRLFAALSFGCMFRGKPGLLRHLTRPSGLFILASILRNCCLEVNGSAGWVWSSVGVEARRYS